MNSRKCNVFIFFMLLFLVSLSCVPQKLPEIGSGKLYIPRTLNGTTFDTIAFVKGRITLFLSKKLNDKEKGLMIAAAEEQLRVFEADWGAKTRNVVVYCFDVRYIRCGNKKGDFLGCHYGLDGPIHLSQDGRFTCGSLYHELVHHNMRGIAGHDDPRWESIWYPRQEQLKKQIAALNEMKGF